MQVAQDGVGPEVAWENGLEQAARQGRRLGGGSVHEGPNASSIPSQRINSASRERRSCETPSGVT